MGKRKINEEGLKKIIEGMEKANKKYGLVTKKKGKKKTK